MRNFTNYLVLTQASKEVAGEKECHWCLHLRTMQEVLGQVCRGMRCSLPPALRCSCRTSCTSSSIPTTSICKLQVSSSWNFLLINLWHYGQIPVPVPTHCQNVLHQIIQFFFLNEIYFSDPSFLPLCQKKPCLPRWAVWEQNVSSNVVNCMH